MVNFWYYGGFRGTPWYMSGTEGFCRVGTSEWAALSTVWCHYVPVYIIFKYISLIDQLEIQRWLSW